MKIFAWTSCLFESLKLTEDSQKPPSVIFPSCHFPVFFLLLFVQMCTEWEGVECQMSFLGLTEQFFSTRNGFLPPKKVKSSFLVPKKVKSSFLVPKKGKSTFLVPKKGKSAFLVPKKGKIPLFWSFLVSKNCLLVRPRKFSFG